MYVPGRVNYRYEDGQLLPKHVGASIRVLNQKYEGGSEIKERFAIQRYLLIIGKKQNMQILSHTFTYFST